ncbi:unnamed protein product [Spirodela intermedia]|uniref:NAC domain-containing protein n=1 Tax=Spirodela intermedia TaxID=51605 RepID=A0A7I8K5S8_SPIIN|nr:unnamed protein product [Spirodela intermedia]
MNNYSHVPPGFRFHPTDEELVDYYLRKKVASREIDLDVIKEVDLYRIEPWDLQEKCRIGAEEQNEWYFFSHKDKKYPTGTRTNRATTAGFWKATGRDKPVHSRNSLIGMRKTLVFYQGRAPNGQKSDWIMHEYRLETNENASPLEEGWVVCRVFKKRVTPAQRTEDHEQPYGYDSQPSFFPEFDPSMRMSSRPSDVPFLHDILYSCKRELEMRNRTPSEHHVHLPQLESPRLTAGIFATGGSSPQNSSPAHEAQIQASVQQQMISTYNYGSTAQQASEQITDWRVLDKFVASQLSHGDASEGDHYPDADIIVQAPEKQEPVVADHGSTSSSNSQAGMWS